MRLLDEAIDGEQASSPRVAATSGPINIAQWIDPRSMDTSGLKTSQDVEDAAWGDQQKLIGSVFLATGGGYYTVEPRVVMASQHRLELALEAHDDQVRCGAE